MSLIFTAFLVSLYLLAFLTTLAPVSCQNCVFVVFYMFLVSDLLAFRLLLVFLLLLSLDACSYASHVAEAGRFVMSHEVL